MIAKNAKSSKKRKFFHTASFVIASTFAAILLTSPSIRARIHAASSAHTILLATGDVMLGRSVNTQTIRSNDPYYPFRNTQDLLSAADITLINLENPLVEPCPTTDTGMKFCAPIEAARTLAFAGIDIANLANNHAQDYGLAGRQSTINALSNESIASIDSARTALLTRNGVKFGFIGFNLVNKTIPDDVLIQHITALRARADVVIVSLHWGTEYAQAPEAEQQRIAKLLADSGASVIVGHHPHVVQFAEMYRGVPIIYSLGNFVFDQMWSKETREGAVGKFVFAGKNLSSYEFIPIAIDRIGQPEVVTDTARSQGILSRLQFAP